MLHPNSLWSLRLHIQCMSAISIPIDALPSTLNFLYLHLRIKRKTKETPYLFMATKSTECAWNWGGRTVQIIMIRHLKTKTKVEKCFSLHIMSQLDESTLEMRIYISSEENDVLSMDCYVSVPRRQMSAVPVTETMQLTNTEIIFTSKSHRERQYQHLIPSPQITQNLFQHKFVCWEMVPSSGILEKRHLLLSTRTANSTRTPTVIQGH